MYIIIVPLIIALLLLIVGTILHFTDKTNSEKYLKLSTIFANITLVFFIISSINNYTKKYFENKIPEEYIMVETMDDVLKEEDAMRYMIYEDSNGIKINSFNYSSLNSKKYYHHYFYEGQEIEISLIKNTIHIPISFVSNATTYSSNGTYDLKLALTDRYALYMEFKRLDDHKINKGINVKHIYYLVSQFFIPIGFYYPPHDRWSYVNKIIVNPYTDESIEILNKEYKPSYIFSHNKFTFKETMNFTNVGTLIKMNINDTIVYFNMGGNLL